ncbi:MAG: HAD-IA family hydrolase [Lentisphaeria bacterium]|nr:HAD-IA family hydrolase [Lentisphaeria bacterium]
MKSGEKRCLVFDLDGTLSDTLPDLVLAVNRMRAEFELPALMPEEVKPMLGHGFDDLLRKSLAGSGVTPEEASEVFRETYRYSLNEQSHLFPGVFQGLRRLKESGWRLALLSNKLEDFCKFILYDFGVGPCFDLIFGGSDEYPLKPDPAPLFAVMEILGTSKEKTWMIGDSATDLETARRAGVNSGFVTYGYGSCGEERPSRIFSTFDELCGFFTK